MLGNPQKYPLKDPGQSIQAVANQNGQQIQLRSKQANG